MRLKNLLLTAALTAPLLAMAVPAKPGAVPVKLADGTTVMMSVVGDETYAYRTDENGYLLTQDANGLRYELRDGQKVLASEGLVQQRRAAAAEAKPLRSPNNLDSDGRTTFPCKGDIHYLVVPVEFSDVKFYYTDIQGVLSKQLNEEGYTDYGHIGSVRDYYITNSNGAFTPTFDVCSEIIELPKTAAYYAGVNGTQRMSEFLLDAVPKVEEKVDLTKYDYNKDGNIDVIVFWYAGYGCADTGAQDNTCIWPHSSQVRAGMLKADGLNVVDYCVFNELRGHGYYQYESQYEKQFAGIGTPVHEFNHVLGLPDLYDPRTNYAADYVQGTPGKWDIMDMGPYNGNGCIPPRMSGYERWFMGWIEYETAVDGSEYLLDPASMQGNVIRLDVLKNSGAALKNEYFLIESRDNSDYDSCLPGQGMLITHINYSKTNWLNNTVNCTKGNKGISLITADGSANFYLGDDNTSSIHAAWPYNINYITPETEITFNTSSTLAQSLTGTYYITNIAYDKATGRSSFEYNKYTEQPESSTVMNMPELLPDADGNATRRLWLTWEADPEATSYNLSLWRVSSAGKIFYEQDLQNKNVGNVLGYALPEELTSTKMKLEYHATVTSVKGLPSKNTSNEVVFKPNTLAVSGVNSVMGDAQELILGGHGSILAPAGAMIYNMQGQQMGRENLMPGIYIVRTATQTAKVRVL